MYINLYSEMYSKNSQKGFVKKAKPPYFTLNTTGKVIFSARKMAETKSAHYKLKATD